MISSFIQLSYVTIIIYFDVHFIPRLVSRILFKVTVSYCNVAISYLSISLLCDITWCSRLILYFTCHSSGISRFSKESYILLEKSNV